MEMVNKETIHQIRAKIGLDEKKIRRAVEAIKDWLQQQPHLPHQYGKKINFSHLHQLSIANRKCSIQTHNNNSSIIVSHPEFYS
jgi:hypothetical protein